jgi:uncharacterized RDD family membrane protein YckC
MSAHRADQLWVTLPEGAEAALATAGARLMARVLDGLLVAVPYLVVVVVLFGAPHGLPALTAVSLGLVAVLLVYDVAMTSLPGGTVGKRLAGIAVADLGGGRPGLRQVVVRSLVLFGPVFVPALGQLYLLCCVVSAVRDEELKRGWPDRAAGTVVVVQP